MPNRVLELIARKSSSNDIPRIRSRSLSFGRTNSQGNSQSSFLGFRLGRDPGNASSSSLTAGGDSRYDRDLDTLSQHLPARAIPTETVQSSRRAAEILNRRAYTPVEDDPIIVPSDSDNSSTSSVSSISDFDIVDASSDDGVEDEAEDEDNDDLPRLLSAHDIRDDDEFSDMDDVSEFGEDDDDDDDVDFDFGDEDDDEPPHSRRRLNPHTSTSRRHENTSPPPSPSPSSDDDLDEEDDSVPYPDIATVSKERRDAFRAARVSGVAITLEDYVKFGWGKEGARRQMHSKELINNWADFDGGFANRPLTEMEDKHWAQFAIDSFAGKFALSTAVGHISRIRNWFDLEGWRWTGAGRLRRAMKVIERDAPASSYRADRDPITVEMIVALHNGLDLSGRNAEDLAVDAAAKVAFFGQARLGEILPTAADPNRYNASHLPLVKDLSLADNNKSYSLFLPKTKTRKFRGDRIFIPRQNHASNPIPSIYRHISDNNLHDYSPLFSYRDANGNLTCLTRKRFMARCNSIWGAKGYPRFTGHSFRIGGTSFYLSKGIDPEIVKATGRWRSEAFKRYWRNLDLIVPQHLTDIFESQPVNAGRKRRHSASF